MRSAVAGQVLVDEAIFDKIKTYERSDEISEKHKVMRLVDAYLIDPQGRIDDGLRAQLFDHFTPEQIVAFTLKAVNYTSQKMLAALGVDMSFDNPEIPRTAEGLRVGDYNRYIENLRGGEIRLPVATPPSAM